LSFYFIETNKQTVKQNKQIKDIIKTIGMGTRHRNRTPSLFLLGGGSQNELEPNLELSKKVEIFFISID